MPYRFEYAWRTHPGRVRVGNEDAVLVQPECGLLMVADGIGGSRAGEVASAIAAEVIAECFQNQSAAWDQAGDARAFVEAAIEKAHLAICQLGEVRSELAGMGTTIVVAAVGPTWLAFAYVGDSRLYRLRAERFEQLSHDHSLIQDVVDQGFFASREDARRCGVGENILTRALGSLEELRVSSGITDLEPGDIFMLCTDGLTGMVPEDWVRQVLIASARNALDPAAAALVHLANERGGSDNITLALLRVHADHPEDDEERSASRILA
ncbi:serine/threonine protein phosphatase [Thiocapsa imhoffii]|uniref:Serine/threonine protein phosphatase n=2 Tax=Thiocapsa imhoffii TaxID=382777 RepID=A0A9X1B7U8_9GAMM|nr:serine/threonine protein phosphatase [Thiocapsa imhoffii]